uniref:Nuclear receptor domain-containing protein n=1 Tax=Panagrolaimus sp. PS1159 TaxID=55785 RepID=A0AC35GNT0_9BILA
MSDKGDCSICEAPTHGMHFGVSTCKACASFFRRSMVERKRYKCRFQDQCIINNKVRNNCRACRLKKCYQAGMIREASPAPTEPAVPHVFGGDQTRCPSTALISPQASYSLSPPQLPTSLTNNLLYNLSVSSQPTVSPSYIKLSSTPDMITLYPRITRLLQAFRSFQHSLKSLYKIENPHAIYEPEEFKQAEKQQYDRLETGTASLIMSMVNEFFPSFFKLNAEERYIKVFRPFAVRFSILYRVYISAVYFNGENDNRICTHYGYYNSVETLDLFFGETPNIAEVKALALPLFTRLNSIKRKAIRIGLREADVSAIIGLIYLTETEDNGGLDFEDQKHKNEIQTELFNNTITTYGFDRAGVQLAEVLSIINDINNLCVVSTESMIIGDLILPKNLALQTWLCADSRYR